MTESDKARRNFGETQLPHSIIKAYGEVKLSAVKASRDYFKEINTEKYNAIINAIGEIISLKHIDKFNLSLLQGGSGTSLNMLFNEVIADIASENISSAIKINPIEDINKFQSTNDTFSTAITIVTLRYCITIEEKIIQLQETLVELENKYFDLLICGRTEMQSAVPITVGQIFASWAGSIERDRWRIHKVKERLRTIALGGTAVGTGFAAPKEYVYSAEKYLRTLTKLPLSRSQNLCDEISNCDKYSEYANTISLCAGNLYKIASDIILYSSSQFNEFILPEKQFGSTIMPFKTNPVIPEFVRGLSLFIQGESNKISSYARNGQLQLNQFSPFILHSVIELSDKMSDALNAFDSSFFKSITFNQQSINYNLINSNCLLNLLQPVCGYTKLKDFYISNKDKTFSSLEELIEALSEGNILSREEALHYLNPVNASSWLKEHISE